MIKHVLVGFDYNFKLNINIFIMILN